MILILKLVPADLSAVTVAAELTDTRHRRQFVQNIILNCTVGCRLMGVRNDGNAKNDDENDNTTNNNNNIIITTLLIYML
jgi:anaerobic selenocysteine-containing dehydrogenase